VTPFYVIHVIPDCPWCTRAKALLEAYSLDYSTTSEPCDEWPTWPAIYLTTENTKELIGGYDQLCSHLSSRNA
jgi:glutaredoxin-related protein